MIVDPGIWPIQDEDVSWVGMQVTCPSSLCRCIWTLEADAAVYVSRKPIVDYPSRVVVGTERVLDVRCPRCRYVFAVLPSDLEAHYGVQP